MHTWYVKANGGDLHDHSEQIRLWSNKIQHLYYGSREMEANGRFWTKESDLLRDLLWPLFPVNWIDGSKNRSWDECFLQPGGRACWLLSVSWCARRRISWLQVLLLSVVAANLLLDIYWHRDGVCIHLENSAFWGSWRLEESTRQKDLKGLLPNVHVLLTFNCFFSSFGDPKMQMCILWRSYYN